MPLDSEHYKSACQIISVLTNLEVMIFDVESTLQLHIAPHDLPDLLEQMRQDALVKILQQPLAREQVVVFHDALELTFLATSLWHGSDYEGIIVVGPAMSKILHPRLLKEKSRQERMPQILQKQLQASYEMLPLIDETRQQAISSLLLNLLAPDLLRPQVIEVSLSLSEEQPQRLTGLLEEHRAMIEKRYQLENNICHAITAGDTRLLTQAMEQLQDISLPFQYSSSPVRSFKNLALMGNALYRKAAEYGGVHPLHLDHVSQTFAFQIEEARTIAELLSSNARIAYIYCDLVKELSLAAFPPLIQEAITFLRVHLDQSFSLTGVADALGVNPTYLSRLFTKEVGMTFTDFVHHLRIEEAKYLLEHRTDSITTIASQVGFQDANYFARVFRKWEGMTPHEYRQRKEERRLPTKETT